MGLGSSQACFVVVDKGGSIVKFFKIVPSILLGTIAFLMDQILNGPTFIFLDLAFVKKLFYFKAFYPISITLDK